MNQTVRDSLAGRTARRAGVALFLANCRFGLRGIGCEIGQNDPAGNQPRLAVEGEIANGPLDEDKQAILEAHEIH